MCHALVGCFGEISIIPSPAQGGSEAKSERHFVIDRSLNDNDNNKELYLTFKSFRAGAPIGDTVH